MEERWLEKSTAFDRGSGESGHESGGNFGQEAAKAERKGAETRIPDTQVQK